MTDVNPEKSVTAFAPASIGNVGVGFDMLGLAIEGVGDRVEARRTAGDGVRIAEVRGLDGAIHPDLSNVVEENTAGVAARALWDAAGESGGVELVVRKGVPLQSGMGSSAASAVAGVVAVNALLESPRALSTLLPYALEGEQIASGTLHADNVAPSLLGGLILSPPVLSPLTLALPAPGGLSSVLVHPDLLVNTAESRRSLAPTCTMEQWLAQQGYLAGFIAGLHAGDFPLIAACLEDVIIEPQRAASVPCFPAAKEAAMAAGALGSSLSGSGPSIFALCENDRAEAVCDAMKNAVRATGIDCQGWISSLAAGGARVESPR